MRWLSKLLARLRNRPGMAGDLGFTGDLAAAHIRDGRIVKERRA